MKGKVLIVEDEPIVALDLKQELETLGCEVLGVAESADEALVAAGVHRPDLALMDVRIVGSVDGIQTAGLLRAEIGVRRAGRGGERRRSAGGRRGSPARPGADGRAHRGQRGWDPDSRPAARRDRGAPCWAWRRAPTKRWWPPGFTGPTWR